MTYVEYQEKRAKINKELQELLAIALQAFNEGSKALIKDLDIESFTWTQYTPYFNDGEMCVFSVNGDAYINGRTQWGDVDHYFHADPDESDDDVSDHEKYAAVGDFINSFSDDDMLAMFGDHAVINVTAAGYDVENYEHS